MNSKRSRRSIASRGLSGLLILALILTLIGCKKAPVKPKMVEAPKEAPVEEVFDKMEDEEANQLILKVRDYAETFEISQVEKTLKEAIKNEVPKGTSSETASPQIYEITSAFMEIELKKKIAEGLDEIVGRHTEEDILLVYEEMNISDLVDFIVSYEIERLKMEGYLR